MSADEAQAASGLNRAAVVETALEMLDEHGVDGLSMRALAARMGIKAASLYWHIRDKDQLLDYIAEAVLERVDVPPSTAGWRKRVTTACDRLTDVVREHRAAADVVLASPTVVQRSRLTRELASVLTAAGLAGAEQAAFSVVVQVVASTRVTPPAAARPHPVTALRLAIDSGSWRVNVRAGSPGGHEVASSVGGAGAPTVEVRPDGEVLVRNRRGGKRGAVELNPDHSWYVKVHGGTWNTSLDLSGLRVTGIELDSGGGNISCVLPVPQGVVPIRVNSGIVNVSLTRPAGTAVHAMVSVGSVKVRFDGEQLRPSAADVVWDTPGALAAADRYDVSVFSGCVKVTMDATAPPALAAPVAASLGGQVAAHSGVELILDGIAARLGTAADT